MIGKIYTRLKRFFILTLLLSALLFPSTTHAHLAGQQPYFKVNGVYSELYSVPTSSLSDFPLPQDIAVGTFLVNVPVEFEIDEAALPVPSEIVEKTKFLWDFGDGTTAEGLKNSHTYSKQGTYTIEIKADSGQGVEPQLLQSTMINILPDKDYQLPKSVIEINGKAVKDPLIDIIDVNFTKELSFKSKSTAGSSEITEILWDLGDQASNTSSEFKYKYSENPYTVFPVLRIKTKDGFIADSFVQIKDEAAFSGDNGFFDFEGMNWVVIALAILISLILAGILTWIISKIFFKESNQKDKSKV
jgi:hypothetical protein